MNSATPYIFPGALLGSLILALFAFTVTSGMALPASNSYSQGSEDQMVEEAPAQDEPVEINQETLVEENASESDTENNETDGECLVSESFPDSILQWCEQITKFSQKNDLDPDLVAALVLQESGGNPQAYSKSGAVGLMQVMPKDGLAASFQCINGPCFSNRPSINQLEDPKFNLQYGTKMLAGLIKKHGDIREALKAYGPMNVGYYYADIILNLYKKYRD